MSDYNQLNNAHPSKFDVIFSKNKEISNAILELVRTAYADHNQEEKERRKKLVECLFKKCGTIVDQLSDVIFRDRLKESVASIVKKDNGFTSELKTQIENDLQQTIEQVSKEQRDTSKITPKTETKIQLPSNKDFIDRVFSNKKFVKNITDFTQQILAKNNDNRLKTLDRIFSQDLWFKPKSHSGEAQTRTAAAKTSSAASETRGQNTKGNADALSGNDLVKNVTENPVRLVKSLTDGKPDESEERKTLTKLFREKLSEKISGTVKQLHHVKYRSLRGFAFLKNKLSPKGIFKLTGSLLFGAIKLFTGLVTGLFKGLFSLVKGVFKLGLNIVGGTFKAATKVVSSIFKVSKAITKGMLKLTVGFFKRIKGFFFTPLGAYVTGFVVGFAVGKIKNLFAGIKEEIEKKFDMMRDSLHEKRMQMVEFFRKDERVKTLKKLLGFSRNWSSFNTKMRLMKRSLDEFTSGASLGRMAGGQIGALMGRVIGTAISAMVPALAPILPGIGTALGAIAGYYIGEAFMSIKDEDYVKKNETNNLLRSITGKYKSKKTSKIKKTREGLKNKIGEIEKRLQDKGITGDERNQLDERKKQYQSVLDDLDLVTNIDDEDATTRHERQKKIDEITKLLNLEQRDGVFSGNGVTEGRQSIFTFPVDPSKGIDYRIDEVFSAGHQLSALPRGVGASMMQMYSLLSRIKVLSLGNAIDAYQKGSIPFEDIQRTANQQISRFLKGTKVTINRPTVRYDSRVPGGMVAKRHEQTMSVQDYFENKQDYNGVEYLYKPEYKDLKESVDNDSKTRTEGRQRLVDDLVQVYKQYAIGRGVDAQYIAEQDGMIETYMNGFVTKNNITGMDQISPDTLGQLYNAVTNAMTLTFPGVDIEETTRRGNLMEEVEKASFNVAKGWKFFTDEQNKKYQDAMNKALIEHGLEEDDDSEIDDDKRIVDAKTQLQESKRRYMAKFAEVMRKGKGNPAVVGIPVMHYVSDTPDYLRANRSSGIEQKDVPEWQNAPFGSSVLQSLPQKW